MQITILRNQCCILTGIDLSIVIDDNILSVRPRYMDRFQFFLRIVLPLSKSIIAVMILFYAVNHWNGYFNALIYMKSADRYPLQLVLRNILFENSLGDMVEDASTLALQQRLGDLIKYGIIIASSLPLLILYPFLQRYFIQGVMIGAIKG